MGLGALATESRKILEIENGNRTKGLQIRRAECGSNPSSHKAAKDTRDLAKTTKHTKGNGMQRRLASLLHTITFS